ncbi:MAG: single-stranded-DNA-specific exonuclease RecJ [Endomicrobium sp.]|jgi:single-stranded-DNA-specific exonuclease|nr:single-stranded-DNA-specific exonuclease RecJ [Endomicrobium sp.]
MSNTDKIWKEVKVDSPKASAIASSLPSSVSKVAQILLARGINTVEKAKEFIYGSVECLHNPFLFHDMPKAIERLKKALEHKELILVYGDRDVDGVTSVNIIVDTVRKLGGDIEWYVPAEEGYGLNKDVISKYASEKVKVLITVDCGISSNEEIEYAQTLRMDVILTDHHETPSECYPNAYAIINPKTANSNYPFKHIAGCVVALKLAQALTLSFSKEYDKNIVLYYAKKDGENFSGGCLSLKNGLEIKKFDFKSIYEVECDLRKAFKVYVNSSEVKDFLIKKDALLGNKVTVIDIATEDIDELKKAYIEKISNDDILRSFYEENLDLCALGIIADSMPLSDENRIIVREGLRIIKDNSHKRPGLGFLLDDVFALKGIENITTKLVSWSVTPVINSSGRMHKGKLSVELLMTKDVLKAKSLYSEIIKLNENRRYLQFENIKQFKHLLKEQCNPESDKVLIVKASNLDHGVTGIVASQMVKSYAKPVFLFITDGKEAIGAVRSVEGFDVVAALESVKDILIKYGGHSQAAGFTLEDSKSDEFIKRICEYTDKNLKKTSFLNTILIETELRISDITVDYYRQVEMMQPFGIGNLQPVFCIKRVTPTEISVFGSRGEHLKFKISQKGSRNVVAIFWGESKLAKFVQSETFLDIAFNIDLTERSDNKTAQLRVLDIKPSY